MAKNKSENRDKTLSLIRKIAYDPGMAPPKKMNALSFQNNEETDDENDGGGLKFMTEPPDQNASATFADLDESEKKASESNQMNLSNLQNSLMERSKLPED